MSSAQLLGMLSSTSGLAIFLGIWLVMMVAMMFPAAAPMAQAYVVLSNQDESRNPWRSSRAALFLGTYAVVWTAFGAAVAVAYLVLAPRFPVLVGSGTLGVGVAAVVLIAAGLYQVTPLKQACLRGCRSPVSFLMTDWRSGLWGAVRLGGKHALYCVGCCWLLFGVLFAVGVMALPWMVLVASFVFVEKLIPGRAGVGVSAGLGGTLAALGAVFLAFPATGSWALGIS